MTVTVALVVLPFLVTVYVKLATPAKVLGGTYVTVPLVFNVAVPTVGLRTVPIEHDVHGSLDRTLMVTGSPGDVIPTSSRAPSTLIVTVAVSVRFVLPSLMV